MKKFVIATMRFRSKAEAIRRLLKYEADGNKDQGAMVYEWKKAYRPTKTFILKLEDKNLLVKEEHEKK